jgi:hypothetical protein
VQTIKEIIIKKKTRICLNGEQVNVQQEGKKIDDNLFIVELIKKLKIKLDFLFDVVFFSFFFSRPQWHSIQHGRLILHRVGRINLSSKYHKIHQQ